MRRAIADAAVGDAVLGDDPTVAELERYAAELLGKEAALFFPSGIMANTAALLVTARPGTEAVIEAGGHILNYEEGAAAAWGAFSFAPCPPPTGCCVPSTLPSTSGRRRRTCRRRRWCAWRTRTTARVDG